MQKDRDAYLLSSYLIIFMSIDVFEMSIMKMPFFGFEACIRYLIFFIETLHCISVREISISSFVD